MKFSPSFLFENIKVYHLLIRKFRVWASDKRVRMSSPASKLVNLSQTSATFCAPSKYAN